MLKLPWKQWLRFHLTLLFAVIFTVLLSQRIGSLPALGSLISPFSGFWQNKPFQLQNRNEVFDWSELKNKVTVSWDEYGVPHIFASSDEDLFMVQGYVHARHRLFQMELTSRTGMGQLSEILGDQTLRIDGFFVHLGMRDAVSKAYLRVLEDSEVRSALTAYSNGVNRWINSLNSKSLPLEYKLLDVSPRSWSPKDSMSIFMVMTFRLAGRSYDVWQTRHLQKFGYKKIKHLFPSFQTDDLIVPYPQGINVLPERSKPFEQFLSQDPFVATFNSEMISEYLQPFATNGSNNWAVSSTKTKDGHTYLANDTHLDFSLPTVWYEQQLKSENFNIYGASIIGSPGLQIGFHPEMAWAVTNGNTDVLDWYEVEYESLGSDKYLFEGVWHQAEQEEEIIHSRSGQSIRVTSDLTLAGRVFNKNKNLGLALKWMGHRSHLELKTFLQLTRAKNHKDCMTARKHYHTPIQNLICADINNISIHHMGVAPKRHHTSGAYIKDGRKVDPDWEAFVEQEEMPQTLNPHNGIVFSANQQVADKNYKYYLSWDWEETYRASRIQKKLLEMGPDITVEKMKALQNDINSPLAEKLLPLLLKQVQKSSLSETQMGVLQSLSNWDYKMDRNSWQASVSDHWWRQLEKDFYEKLLGPKKGNSWPRNERTVQLLSEAYSKDLHLDISSYWFLGGVSSVKALQELLNKKITESFLVMWKDLEREYGNDHTQWLWKKVQPTNIKHLLRIDGLSALNVEKGGGRYTIDVNNGKAGAVWRQIVKLGKDFEAYTMFPGGPSGNPFSKFYDINISDWAKGSYKKIHFLEAPLILSTPEEKQ